MISKWGTVLHIWGAELVFRLDITSVLHCVRKVLLGERAVHLRCAVEAFANVLDFSDLRKRSHRDHNLPGGTSKSSLRLAQLAAFSEMAVQVKTGKDGED